MTNKTSRNIKICSYVALTFCVVWAVSDIANFVAFIFGGNASSHSIDWSQNTFMKVFIFFCYVAGTIALIGMCVKVVFNTLKGLRENIAFPRSNEKLMFWIALADFVYLFGRADFSLLWKDDVVLQLTHTNFLSPFFLLFFAFMYKVAADAVEENNLTV